MLKKMVESGIKLLLCNNIERSFIRTEWKQCNCILEAEENTFNEYVLPNQNSSFERHGF